MQAATRGRQDRKRVQEMRAAQGGDAEAAEEDPAASLGLEGSAEEDAAAAKLQAMQRGKQDRAKVAELKGKKAVAEFDALEGQGQGASPA